MTKIFTTIKKHKIIFFILLLVMIGGGYYGYNKFRGNKVQISYMTAAARKGTLIVSVSSSGQVSASNQVDITPKVSGDITKVAVKSGQEAKAGDLIAQIDASAAYKTIRDAQTNLQSAQLAMDKLKQPVDSYSLIQAENALTNAKTSLEKLKLSQPVDYQTAIDNQKKAEDNLNKTYEDAFNAISDAFVNFPTIMSSLNDILYGYQISLSETSVAAGQYNMLVLLNSSDVTDLVTDRSKIQALQDSVEADYKTAEAKYNACLKDYKNLNRYFNNIEIENLLTKTADTAKAIAQAIKNTRSYLDAWSDFRTLRNRLIFSKVTEYKISLITYSDQANSHLINLQSVQIAIKNNKDLASAAENNIYTLDKNNPLDMAAAEASIKEKQALLVKLKAGTDPLDIRSQELSLQQKRNALLDAQTALADYTIKAPFAGIIAAVKAKIGDSAGSAVIATIVTKQQIAEISLNEVDVAKIKIGDKAMLTFDALDGLNISGQVAEIDSIGTVAQGVVTYNVKIIFDTQDARVKSGMSANATIIIDSKVDVLLAPSSAIKNNGADYVEVLDASGQPQRKPVEIGTSNDTTTEIISGLNEGDKIVTQTIISGAAKTTTGQSGASGVLIPGITGGGTGGGANNFRRIGN